MQFVEVQEITITPTKHKGSNRIARNYDLNGVPFGCIYTFKAPGEKHYWHVALANGEYAGVATDEADADKIIRGMM
jgi:hypothetical protein